MLNILLVGASTSRYERVTWAGGYSSAPLGLLYLAAVARMHGHRVKCVDQLVQDISRAGFRRLLEDFHPDVVGLTVYTESVSEAVDVAHMAREHGAVVVVGGAHATFAPEDVLRSGLADYVVRYEGEATFVAFLLYLEHGLPARESIRGLGYLDPSGVLVLNERRPLIEALDGLPFPAVDELPVTAYACPLVCLTSRGCPGRCLFCLSPPMHGARYRTHSVDRVISETVTLARRYPGRTLAIIDDTFTRDAARLESFCRQVKSLVPGLTWFCYSRVDALDEDIVARMAEAGCIGIQLGIEAGDQEVADSIGKRISLEHAERIVEAIYRHDIMPLCSLMLGHHTDTPDSARRTIEYGRRLTEKYRALVTFAVCAPFPGSPVYSRCERLGVRLHARSWSDYVMTDPFISTPHLSRDDLRELFFEAHEAMNLDPHLKDYWNKVLTARVGPSGGVVGLT